MTKLGMTHMQLLHIICRSGHRLQQRGVKHLFNTKSYRCTSFGGLKERPLTENAGRGGGCFQSGSSREKQGIWELKITTKPIFF